MISIKRYSESDNERWDEFVANSKNTTFLLQRKYMDYHRERFDDHSLICVQDQRIVALLPAHQTTADTLVSHQGLTYGGLILDVTSTTSLVIQVLEAVRSYLLSLKIHQVIYKPTPWIYHDIPSEEDLYGLYFVGHLTLLNKEVASVISLDRRPEWDKSRRNGYKKSLKNQITVSQSQDYKAFWEILSGNLHEKYQAKPVHTCQEITLLAERFPQNIRLFVAYKSGVIVGGTVLYIIPNVIHAQYISATSEGKKAGAIDAIFHHVLASFVGKARYLDFGKSTEQGGKKLNETLIYQKEGFGGRAVCYDTYLWEI